MAADIPRAQGAKSIRHKQSEEPVEFVIEAFGPGVLMDSAVGKADTVLACVCLNACVF